MAEFLSHLNFICCLKHEFDVKIAFKRSNMTYLEEEILSRCDIVDRLIENESGEEYDACFILQYTPFAIQQIDLSKKDSKLHNLLLKWKKYQEEMDRKRYIEEPAYDVNVLVYALNNKKNILELLDPSDSLGIAKHYKLKLTSKKNRARFIYGKYITVHAPNDKYSKTREWPVEYYEKLLAKLHMCFPEYKLLSIGMGECKQLQNVDIDLSGKLTPVDFCDLLKNACLHIDTIPEYAHLRAAMGKISCVLWGAMPEKVFSLPEDINIHSDSCSHWCMNLNDTWQENCVSKGVECLNCIKPYQVFEEILKNKERWS